MRRAKVLMVTAISTTLLLSLAAILPATATIATAFAQIPRHFLLDQTTLPIIIYKPSLKQDNTILLTPSPDTTTTVIIGSGSFPATDVFLKIGDIRGES